MRIWPVMLLVILAGSAHAGPTDQAAAVDAVLKRVESMRRDGRVAQATALLDSALVQARADGDRGTMGRLMLQRSAILNDQGESGRALSLLYEAMATVRGTGDSLMLAEVLNSIGTIQHSQRNYKKAGEYYRRSGSIYQKLGLERETGKYWNNLGSLSEDQGDPAAALVYHRRSLGVWNALGDTGWAALSYMHLGTCYGLLGRTDSARYFLDRSIRYQGADSKSFLMAVTMMNYGVNEHRAGMQRKALRYCNEGLDMAIGLQSRMLQQEACDCLFKTYDAMGDKGRALDYYHRSILLRDSIFGEAKVKDLTRIEMDHEFAQKQLADSLIRAKRQVEEQMVHQAEVSKARETRNLALYGGVALLIVAVALWARLRNMRFSRARIQLERERSERLLLNILPGPVAQELKDKGKVMARDYPAATILFSDFKDFTHITQAMTAQALVEELDTCFKAFDRILDASGVEKIKTIGDAYMCVCGLPGLAPATPVDMVQVALEMQAFVAKRKAERDAKGLIAFTMRVGIHTGPVVAGIVGLKKFAFDIWGDAVNTACAMERSGEEGKVNISATTYGLVRNGAGLVFTPRGKVEAKGKGPIEMYFASATGPVKHP